MLTTTDLDAVLASPSHDGYGYNLGRWQANEANPVLVNEADAMLINWANDHEWDRFDLFEWTNSRNARHYAEQAYEKGIAIGPETDSLLALVK